MSHRQRFTRSRTVRLSTSLGRKVAHLLWSSDCDYWLLLGLKGQIGKRIVKVGDKVSQQQCQPDWQNVHFVQEISFLKQFSLFLFFFFYKAHIAIDQSNHSSTTSATVLLGVKKSQVPICELTWLSQSCFLILTELKVFHAFLWLCCLAITDHQKRSVKVIGLFDSLRPFKQLAQLVFFCGSNLWYMNVWSSASAPSALLSQ